jgi:membrane associated rhomboid family serine protease
MHDDQRRILHSMIYPSLFVIVIWLVKIAEILFHTDLTMYGLQPLKWRGLIGIVTSPLLHVSFSHLWANTIPLFVLGSFLFYFYRQLAWRIILLTWFLTGLWVWFLARGDAVHVGASGIIYGMASFLFFSGIIRRDARLMVLTLLVTFLYGGLIWGIFPKFFPNEHISWESHMMGLLAGLVLAVYYRNAGPKRKIYDWENEDDEDDGDDTNGGGWGEPGWEDDLE